MGVPQVVKNIIQKTFVALMLVLGFAVLATPVTVSAVDTTQVENGINAVGGGGTTGDDLPKLIQNIINILLFIAGAVAVVMIILGGIRYITSNGDQAQVKAAKDTILYSVVGLVVAILAFSIVNFVVSKL